MDPKGTAAPIARIRAEEGLRPEGERLFDDPYARLFDDAGADVSALFSSVPFFALHVRLRTRFIDETVREALASGVRDVVLVGAGFDARALRMPEIRAAGARVIEIDHADQIEEKRRRFGEAGVEVPAHVTYAPADLAEDGALARALQGAGLAPGARVHWVCEGLLGYLPRDAITALAERTAELSGTGSSLVANHFVPVWTSEALLSAFASSSWQTTAGPFFDDLHRRFLGPDLPPGGGDFAFIQARR